MRKKDYKKGSNTKEHNLNEMSKYVCVCQCHTFFTFLAFGPNFTADRDEHMTHILFLHHQQATLQSDAYLCIGEDIKMSVSVLYYGVVFEWWMWGEEGWRRMELTISMLKSSRVQHPHPTDKLLSTVHMPSQQMYYPSILWGRN